MSDYLKASLDTAVPALTPNSTPNDVLGVVEILSLITDPAAHKKRLDELQNATAEANRKIADAKAASEKRRTAENMFAEAAKIMAERKTAAAKMDARSGDLDRREKDLVDREGKLSQRMKDHEVILEDRQIALANRERVTTALEVSNTQEAQKLAAERTKIEKQKAKFHAALAGE